MEQRAGLRLARELREPGERETGTHGRVPALQRGRDCVSVPGTAPAGHRGRAQSERARGRLSPRAAQGQPEPARGRGATFRTSLGESGGAALAEWEPNAAFLGDPAAGQDPVYAGTGQEPVPPPVPLWAPPAPGQERTFPVEPLPRDVRGHCCLPATKPNPSSAPLGVCHREKPPRCERAPSVLPFRETQIYFFRQVSSSPRPALSGTCQGRKPLQSCRGGILISGSPCTDRAQP